VSPNDAGSVRLPTERHPPFWLALFYETRNGVSGAVAFPAPVKRLLRGAALVLLLSAALGVSAASAADRFAEHGITFEYPSAWVVTTEALSNGINPKYRFAVSTTPVHRTGQDLGPCLAGIAKQIPETAVLVYLREALGADRRASLPNMQPRPRSFRLPTRADASLPCFGRGGRWVPFRTGGRAFYLGIYTGPNASSASIRAVERLLKGLRIAAR
jgi:hypothetical protein